MLARPKLTALIAGLVSATGFAPLDWWPVLILCLALLLWLVHEAPRPRSAFAIGWWFGLGHFTVGNNWIQHAFDYQDKMPHALGYFAVVLLAAYLAIYPALAMGLASRFKQSVRKRNGWQETDLGFVLAAAAAWIVTEWLRSVVFTGYPWDPLGVAWLPLEPVAGIARLIGTYGLSGLMVAVAGLVYLASQRQFRPLVIGAGAITLLALAALPFEVTAPSAVPRRVVVVQPDIGQEAAVRDDYAELTLSKMIALSGSPGPVPRLVVWPEGMIGQYIEDGYPLRWYFMGDPRLLRARIAAPLGPRDIALIGGNSLRFDADGHIGGAGNSVWVIDSKGMLRARYDKAHLVPFGEYLPMRDLLGAIGLSRLVMGDLDFIPGPGPRTIDLPGFGKAGMLICYEVIFSGRITDRAHRPDFLFNASYDAWYGSWGPVEHLAQSRMRAIEEGLPMLRATPTGISAVIDARGRIVAQVPMRTAGATDIQLPAPLPPTPFARFGNALAFVTAALLLLIAIANRRFAR